MKEDRQEDEEQKCHMKSRVCVPKRCKNEKKSEMKRKERKEVE